MADSDELAYKTIPELAALLRSRALSPVELLDATLARIRLRNPSLGAFVYLNEEYAYGQAKEAERRLAANEDVSPLTGLPTAIKDLADSLPGWKGTYGGIRSMRDNVIEGALINRKSRVPRALDHQQHFLEPGVDVNRRDFHSRHHHVFHVTFGKLEYPFEHA